jgi:hypothetical protein
MSAEFLRKSGRHGEIDGRKTLGELRFIRNRIMEAVRPRKDQRLAEIDLANVDPKSLKKFLEKETSTSFDSALYDHVWNELVLEITMAKLRDQLMEEVPNVLAGYILSLQQIASHFEIDSTTSPITPQYNCLHDVMEDLVESGAIGASVDKKNHLRMYYLKEDEMTLVSQGLLSGTFIDMDWGDTSDIIDEL